MARIQPIDPAQNTGKTKHLLDGVKAKLGVTPNMMKTMAQSPAALEAYLNFSGTLGHGVLGAKFQEQLALAVGQENACEYCVAAHTVLGKGAGLTTEEVILSRKASFGTGKVGAGL
jgi:AhpD family alkylhydroperoxidase